VLTAVPQGFFHSLFQSSGFAETKRSFRDKDEIEIIFDDPNITRPAFEYAHHVHVGGIASDRTPGSAYQDCTEAALRFTYPPD
jgi:hypothetical protein